MSECSIRPAVAGDLAALVEIESHSFRDERFTPRQMRYLLLKAKAVTLVAENEAGVVGYAIALLPSLPKPARLYSIAVAEHFRGKKIAEALIRELLNYCLQRGYQKLRLEVRQSQQRALSLYRRMGFNEIGRLANYYPDGEAALHMQRTIDDSPENRDNP